MPKIEISESLYRRSHMRAPRGFGVWLFIVMDDTSAPAREHTVFTIPCGCTLSDAKKHAKAIVRDRFAAELATGHLFLEVAP